MQIHFILFTFQTDFLNGRKQTPFPCATAPPSACTAENGKEQNASAVCQIPAESRRSQSILTEHTQEAYLCLSFPWTRPPRPVWLALAWVQSARCLLRGPGSDGCQASAMWPVSILPCSVAQRLKS